MATPSATSGRALSAAPQTQSKEALLKSYTKRLKDDVKAMVDNYLAILNLSKFEDNAKNLAQISRYYGKLNVCVTETDTGRYTCR